MYMKIDFELTPDDLAEVAAVLQKDFGIEMNIKLFEKNPELWITLAAKKLNCQVVFDFRYDQTLAGSKPYKGFLIDLKKLPVENVEEPEKVEIVAENQPPEEEEAPEKENSVTDVKGQDTNVSEENENEEPEEEENAEEIEETEEGENTEELEEKKPDVKAVPNVEDEFAFLKDD